MHDCDMMTRSQRLRFAWVLCWISIVTLAAVCCAPPPAAAPAPPALQTPRLRDAAARSAATIQLQRECTSGDLFLNTLDVDGAYGSGVMISERDAITAAHVVRCEGRLRLHTITVDGRRIAAEVVSTDVDHDLATIRLLSPAHLGISPPVLAHPSGVLCVSPAYPARTPACGAATANYYDGTSAGEIHFGAVVRPGNSGGGVYDEEGRLVGIATTRVLCTPSDGMLASIGFEVEACSGRAARLVRPRPAPPVVRALVR